MLAVPLPPPDSTTSGYRVPWTRNSTVRPCAPACAMICAVARSNARMNSRPMILRFSSGSATPARAPRNAPEASSMCRSTPVAATKSFSTCGLALAQQPVIHEHAGEPVADGALHQRRRDRGIHSAGQPADGSPVADLLGDQRNLLVDDAPHGPVRPAAGRHQ